MKGFIKILQYIWLLAGVVCLVFAIISFKNKGFSSEIILFLSMAVIAVIMFIVNGKRYKNHPGNQS